MKTIIEHALERWGMKEAKWSFVAGRENQVFRVDAGNKSFALRIKRPGYRDRAELLSELQWLEAMDQAGLHVPRPVQSMNGDLLETIDGFNVDVVRWLAGKPLGKSRQPLDLADRTGTFRAIGAEIAKLHLACDTWRPPPGFRRCDWDIEGLLGDNPVWGRFWENPTLDGDIRDRFVTFRHVARRLLSAHAADLDHGLIHADFVRENILLDDTRIAVIDFDDGGFGFRQFDLATVLLKNLGEADFPELRLALIEGYLGHRQLDLQLLDIFVALRATTYVGWITSRMGEQGGDERNRRFVSEAALLCAPFVT